MTIKEWWEKAHREKNEEWLSGNTGKTIWEFLNIVDLIQSSKTILNIGVGLGYDTKELYDRKVNVQALDISEIALERVKNYIVAGYLSTQLGDIPSGKFDLAISYLVVQHINEKDLLEQMSVIIRSLKPDGIFAMQFATGTDKGYKKRENLDAQMRGGVCWTLEEMKQLVERANGKIVWASNPKFWYKYKCKWYAIHIKRR